MRAVLGAVFAISFVSALWADDEPKTDKTFNKKSFLYYMMKITDFDEPTKYRAQEVPLSMTWSNSQSSDRHILIGCILNGREIGCLPTIVDLFKEFKEASPDSSLSAFQGRITFFIANPETAVTLESADQNLAFGNSPDGSPVEIARASELKKLITDDVDLFIELNHRHSDVMKSAYVFPYDDLTFEWAKHLGASSVLIAPVEYNNRKKMTMAEYARNKGILSLRLDLFQKDDSEKEMFEAYTTSKQMIEKAVSARSRIDKMNEIYGLVKKLAQLSESDETKKSTKALELKKFYRTVYVEPFTKANAALKDSYKEFSPVTEGEVVGTLDGVELKAPQSGLMLRPRYPKRDEKGNAKEPLPRYLYELIQEVKLEDLAN